MLIDSEKYDRLYAEDVREQALEEAVARALCDACYGEGSWQSLTSSQGLSARQKQSWIAQAQAAIKVMKDWHR